MNEWLFNISDIQVVLLKSIVAHFAKLMLLKATYLITTLIHIVELEFISHFLNVPNGCSKDNIPRDPIRVTFAVIFKVII